MTNRDLVIDFINGEKECGACNHLFFKGNELYNYSPLLCTIDRYNRIADLNIRKYSRTTSKIQSMIGNELASRGYAVSTYDGRGATMWNCGFQGAECWTVKEVRAM